MQKETEYTSVEKGVRVADDRQSNRTQDRSKVVVAEGGMTRAEKRRAAKRRIRLSWWRPSENAPFRSPKMDFPKNILIGPRSKTIITPPVQRRTPKNCIAVIVWPE
jgi:hypothetical protein